MKIKAIQTEYKGYLFRSRLEARWAVFFDALDIEWEYEPEGFELSNGRWYLPDFYLPCFDAWVEIKPKKGSREEVFTILQLMLEDGIANEHKAWGFIGDPLDHHWILPVYRHEDQFFKGRKTAGRGWGEEWGDMTSVCFLLEDEGVNVSATFSLTTAERIGIKAEHIDNYTQKVAARSARFEHGQKGW